MSVRKRLLGLAVVTGVAGSAVAQQSGRPLAEGREMSPVARELYEPDPPTFGYRGGPPVAETPANSLSLNGWLMTEAARELLLDHLTVPLGAVKMWD